MEQALRDSLRSLLTAGMPTGSSSATPDHWVYSTCGYCSVGCGLYIGVKDGKAVAVQGNPDYPVNEGHLCVKGLYEWKVIHHPQRATTPLIRKDGQMVPATWDEALGLLVTKIKENTTRLGPTSVGVYHTGQFLMEEYYVLGKLTKGVLGTPNVDSNTRLCMAAAVQGYTRSFGTDGPPGCYEDLDVAEVILIFGSNPAEMHPQLWRRILKNKEQNGAKLIVVDPRLTLPARIADLHLDLKPGTNVPLLNGIAHVLLKEELIDRDFLEKHTTGFNALESVLSTYSPEHVSALTGVPAEKIIEAAHLFGRAASASTFFCQGVNQSMSATDAVTLINNLHLLTGKIGKPGSAPFSISGQSTAMSNREVGGSASLPGFRNLKNPLHRQAVADYWGIEAEKIPESTHDIMKMMDMIRDGEMNVLWTMGTNPAVSLPDQGYVRKMLDKVFLVVQDVYYPMETAMYADIFLPAAQWGEKTGAYTNSERRVNVGYKAVSPPGEAKADFDIFVEVGKRLGAGALFAWENTEAAFDEWKGLSVGRPNDMSGMTYRRMEQENGLQWPCPAQEHPGQARLYSQGVFNNRAEVAQAFGEFNDPEGRAHLWAVHYQAPPEVPDGEYPFWLNTGRIIEHFHTRTKTKRVPELDILAGEGFVEINPQDAEMRGIREGDVVKVSSRRGNIRVKAKLKNTVKPGEVFVPFHFGDVDPDEAHLKQAANHLTLNWVDPICKQPIFKVSACKIEREG